MQSRTHEVTLAVGRDATKPNSSRGYEQRKAASPILAAIGNGACYLTALLTAAWPTNGAFCRIQRRRRTHDRNRPTPRIRTFPDVSKQRQLHLAPLAHRQRHGVSPFHIFYSSNEVRVRHRLAAAYGVDELLLHAPGADFCWIDRKRAHGTAFLTEPQVRLGVVRRDEGQRAFVAEYPGFGLARRVTEYLTRATGDTDRPAATGR